MRISAGSIKKKTKLQDKPREGSKLRVAYDRALTGEPFNLRDLDNTHKSLKRQLQEYNLEFVTEPDPSGPNRRQYRCIGIWIGVDLRTLDEVEVALNNSVLRDNKAAM